MSLSSSDFYSWDEVPGVWGATGSVEVLDTDRLTALISASDPVHNDVAVSLALMDLVRDDLQLSGTTGDSRISDPDMRLAIRALERSTSRAGFDFRLPFRDHASWRSYWVSKGASGSGGWQARRNLLSDLFDEPYAALMAAHDRHLDSTIAEAVSPRDRLGWPEVDTEIGELRKHFRTATTPQDYRAVGNDCVHLTEALSRKVYVHAEHGPAGPEEPSADKTKDPIDCLHRGQASRCRQLRDAEVRKSRHRVGSGREAPRHAHPHRSWHPRGRGRPPCEHVAEA